MPYYRFKPGDELTAEMMLVALAISKEVGIPLAAIGVVSPDSSDEHRKPVDLCVAEVMRLIVIFKGTCVVWSWRDESEEIHIGTNASSLGINGQNAHTG